MMRLHTRVLHHLEEEERREEVVDIIPLQSLTARTILWAAQQRIYCHIPLFRQFEKCILLLFYSPPPYQQFSIPKLPWPRKVNIWTSVSFRDDSYVIVCTLLNLDTSKISFRIMFVIYLEWHIDSKKAFDLKMLQDILCLFL